MNSDTHHEKAIATSIVNGNATPVRTETRKKRTFHRKNVSQEDLDDVLYEFQNLKQGIRLPASNIAAIAGFNPYSHLPTLFMDLVYQGSIGQKLLHRDALLLNIQLVSEEHILTELAIKAGVKDAFKKSVEVSRGTVEVKSVQDAKSMKQSIVQKAKGTVNEDDALNMYEKKCGWEVHDRNEQLRVWNFKRHQRDGMETVQPIGEPQILPPLIPDFLMDSSVEKKKDMTVIILDSDDEDCFTGCNNSDGHCSNGIDESKPFFSIIGIADGIRDELYCEPLMSRTSDDTLDDADNWQMRKVVVECKHRMKDATVPPPFHDQIQAIVYCFMYKTSESDLIQIVRTRTSKRYKKSEDNYDDMGILSDTKDSQNEHPESASITITTSRISLDDQIMKHRENWNQVILPRLRQFVETVYMFRGDDHKRYCLLKAAAEASSSNQKESDFWSLILDDIPYLKDCDIALYRA